MNQIEFPNVEALHRPSFGARVRAWFFTGLIITGPLTVTIWLVWWFVDTVDNWVKPLMPPFLSPDAYTPFHIPGVGVVVAFLGLTFLGFLAANFAGRAFIRIGEAMLDRMPVVRGLYKSVKQIFETIFSQSGTSFRKVGLVQYPAPGMWSIVFISAPPAASLSGALPAGEHVSVFLPCTPNPTTGFYFFLPVKDVIEIPMTPDDAAKLIMSAGLIQPEMQVALSDMADKAKAAKELEKAE